MSKQSDDYHMSLPAEQWMKIAKESHHEAKRAADTSRKATRWAGLRILSDLGFAVGDRLILKQYREDQPPEEVEVCDKFWFEPAAYSLPDRVLFLVRSSSRGSVDWISEGKIREATKQ